MLGTAIIVFREVLEAALIVGIVMAASYGAPRRRLWVGCGIAGGVGGAGLVAGFAASIAGAVSGIGQELLDASVLLVAVVMLAWHNLWMARHGREMAASARAVGDAVTSGSRPLYALAVVTGLAVLREGSETVLFLYGLTAGGGLGAAALLAGGALGLAGGLGVGAALYYGLLRIPPRHLFAVTGWMVLLLAAGMASQAAGFLVQADLLPPLGERVWDTSAVLTENSLAGKALHTLIGYVARPQGIQILFYLATLLIIGLLMRRLRLASARAPRPGRGAAARTATAIGALALFAALPAAQADEFKMRSPIIDYREVELEHNGQTTFDAAKSGKSNNQFYNNEIEVGVLPFWKVGLEGNLEAASGENLRFDETAIESFLQLTPQGKYFADFGFFTEYAHPTRPSEANTLIFGPLVESEFGQIAGTHALHTLNILFTKEVGRNAGGATPIQIAWESRLLVHPMFEPGIEYFGQVNGEEPDQHRLGPVIVGRRSFAPYGAVRYEIGYLAGLTRTTEAGMVRWRLEYEIPF
jgi:high-affinity iron transporter